MSDLQTTPYQVSPAMMADEYGRLVWLLHDTNGSCVGSIVGGEAVARQFAAAPELLKRLEDIMGWIDSWAPDFTDDEAWPEYEGRAKEAIAAAKGERA